MQTNQTAPHRIATRKSALGLLVSFFVLVATTPGLLAQNGTWTNLVSGNASGSWATAVNWNNSVIADGADNTADFSTLDLTGTNSVVTLDGARTIGNIVFGDATPSTNWVLNTGTAGPLTLAVTTGTPTLTANNGTNIIGAVLVGTNGFTKAGAGTLRLNGANTALSGNININAGILQAGSATLGTTTPNGSLVLSNAVVIAPGATLQVMGGVAPTLKPAYVGGTGVGGTMGAIYADLSNLGNNNNATRWSIGLLTATSPGVIMTNDTTIRVDGTNITALGSVMLIGHITTSNALTGVPANFPYTLTKTGTGRLTIDPAGGYTGGDIHVVGGGLRFGNNNDLLGSQTVTIDAGAVLHLGNITSMNSINSSVVVNGLLDMNGRGNGTAGSDVTVAADTIGYLSGSGVITNGGAGNVGAGTLTISGTNGTSTTFSGKIVQAANGSIGLRLQNTNSTLRLTGANTYAGATTINAGTLLVNGSHTNGAAYTVGAGATLGGNGTIYSAITLNGALRAGDGGGTLTVGNVTGAGDVIISNVNLTALSQLNNSGSGNLNSLYLGSNTVTTITLQGGSEASIYATTVNVDGTNNTLNVSIGNPALGQFPLIGGISSLGGLNGFSGLKLQVPVGVGAYLSNNITSIDMVVTNIPALVWRGTPTGDWTIGGSLNWLSGVTPFAYTETAGLGPFVVFDDTAAGTTSVNLAANVTPRGVTVNASSKSYTLSGTGRVSGTGGWVKDGSSTFTVANSVTNNFTGSVAINGGTVQFGNGGTAGDVGAAAIINSASGSLAFNRSDDVTFANTISGNGTLVQQGANKVNLTGVGNVAGSVTVSNGALTLSPAGSITVSGDVTGGGAFGTAGAGTVILTSATLTYSNTVISSGTLQFNAAFPPAGNITNHGRLALALSGTLANNVSGSGGVSAINSSAVTLSGANTYTGPTTVLGTPGAGSVDATASTYPSSSVLTLGSQAGTAEVGIANFTAGSPVLGGLRAGGNNTSPGNTVNLSAGQTLTINGDLRIGNVSPALAAVRFQVVGTGVTVVVNTNGGTIQLGLYTNAAAGNPDSLYVDLSGIDNFVANLGATGLINLGTLDGVQGPSPLAVNQFLLASVSNSITAGAINIGAGGRELIPQLLLGAGTNRLNVDTLNLGNAGRDGGYLLFSSGSGGVRVRANDGVSRANLNVGVNPSTTGANRTNTVDLLGHSADLLLNALVIGNLNNAGVYECQFSFDQGELDALSTSLSATRNNNANAAASSSTLNIGGGTASLGPVSLTASLAAGTLNITGGTVSVQGVTDTGLGTGTMNVSAATLSSVGRIGTAASKVDVINLNNTTLSLGRSPGYGNPTTALMHATNLSLSGTCPITLTGTNYVVGQFPLISYVGSIGGGGYLSIGTFTPPPGVTATLVDNAGNQSVDVNITAAPPAVKTSLTVANGVGTVDLSWPPADRGMILQTNSTAVTDANAWFTYPNSTSMTNVTITIDPGKTNVYFRLSYPNP